MMIFREKKPCIPANCLLFLLDCGNNNIVFQVELLSSKT